MRSNRFYTSESSQLILLIRYYRFVGDDLKISAAVYDKKETSICYQRNFEGIIKKDFWQYWIRYFPDK